jgi:hypothetical protein
LNGFTFFFLFFFESLKTYYIISFFLLIIKTRKLAVTSRCLENRTRIESPMNGISDEEVDYGSFDSSAYPATDSDRAWSPSID